MVMGAQMQTARLIEPRMINLIATPVPEPEAGFVRVKVLCTGVCGSDLSTWQGHHPYKRAPTVLGHEFSGVIDQIGPGISQWKVGQRVCAMAYAPCDHCEFCLRGSHQLCPHKSTFSYQGWDGSFAEYVLARDNMLFELPSAIDDECGALVEPLAIGLHAVRKIGVLSGKRVAIIGSGNIGLACCLVIKQQNARDIVCIDIDKGKETLALACGATEFVPADTKDSKPLFDAVVLACDYPEAVNDTLQLMKPGGKAVIVSYFGARRSSDIDAMVRAERTLIGSALADRNDFETVIGWIANGTVNPRPMITHRMPLSHVGQALQMMADLAVTSGKIMLKPTGD